MQLKRSLVLGLVLWIIALSAAQAAPEPPAWRQNLDCDSHTQNYRGLEYCTGGEGQVHVVVVDLHSPGVRFEYIIAKGVDRTGNFGECNDVNIPKWGPVRGGCADPNGWCWSNQTCTPQSDCSAENRCFYPVISLPDAVTEAKQRYPNTAAVVNSDYGAGDQDEPKSRGHGPEGLTIIRGERLDGPENGDTDNNAVNRPWLIIGENTPLQARLDKFESDADNRGKPNDWAYTGVGGAPWLIREGNIQEEDIASCKGASGSCYAGAHQSAVGLSRDGRWMFLVVDVREGQLIDLAHFMAGKLDPWNAIKFDGGGSSQLWYDGEPITTGDGRRLSQYLAVIAPHGSGIEITPPEESPPTDWWETWKQKIQKAIEQKFEELKERAGDEFDRRWEEFQAWLSDFLQHEVERLVQQWLDQVCGSSALLLGGMLFVALRSYRWRKTKIGSGSRRPR